MKKNLLLLSVLIAFSTSIFAQVPSYVPTNGLIGWWPFNGNANDESGNGNNAMENNIVYSNDRNDQPNSSISLNGVTSFLTLSNPIMFYDSLNTQYTVSLWFLNNGSYGNLLSGKPRMTQFNNPNFTTQYLYNWSLKSYSQCEYIDSNCIGYEIPEVSGFFNTDTLNNWKNLVLVKNDNVLNYYIDGHLKSSIVIDTIQIQSIAYTYYGLNNLIKNGDLFINCFGATETNLLVSGNYNLSYDEFFDGKLDDIGIWNEALTECEIQSLYNAQFGASNTTNMTACESYAWNGSNYNQSGQYTFQTTNINGCDSIAILNLTINQPSSSTQIETALDSFIWSINNQTYTQSGTYTAVIPNTAGCDSTITLDLTLSFTGIDEQEDLKIIISPNPAREYFMISASEELIGETYSIIDLNGKTLKEGTLTQKEQKIDIGNLSKGMYLFKIINKTEQTFRFVKN
jgi:hypothetical protein